VCRDFTHLAISFCRALNIPARYVFGYLPFADALDPTTGDPATGAPTPASQSTGNLTVMGNLTVERDDQAPMDFAAWMEVWLGDRWWTFDPRNNTGRKGRVVIGRGRDATDVAMATTFGGPFLESMVVQTEEAAG
jgi:transglutaminase-like putative cysteine protease